MQKRFLLPVLALGLLSMITAARAADGLSWQTDYKAALKQAVASNKPILVDFTGSDWCGWCIKLDKETFSQPEFAKFAGEKLVLMEADFPQGKEQSAAVKKQNDELQKKFNVEGFPTLVLLDKNGKEIARNVGYLPGGPAGMIAWINKSLAKP
jgi:protein disulfide-isomerase